MNGGGQEESTAEEMMANISVGSKVLAKYALSRIGLLEAISSD